LQLLRNLARGAMCFADYANVDPRSAFVSAPQFIVFTHEFGQSCRPLRALRERRPAIPPSPVRRNCSQLLRNLARGAMCFADYANVGSRSAFASAPQLIVFTHEFTHEFAQSCRPLRARERRPAIPLSLACRKLSHLLRNLARDAEGFAALRERSRWAGSEGLSVGRPQRMYRVPRG
jgi:hypothetical protein